MATLAQLVYSSSHGRSGTLTELLAKGDTDLQGWPVGGKRHFTGKGLIGGW